MPNKSAIMTVKCAILHNLQVTRRINKQQVGLGHWNKKHRIVGLLYWCMVQCITILGISSVAETKIYHIG